MPDFPTLADLGDEDPTAPAETLAPAATPAESPAPAAPSLTRQVLDWFASEGFRARLDEDGDIHVRHEGRDVYVLLDPDDPAYVRFIFPGVWKCGDTGDERSIALVVGNALNGDMKALKLFLRPGGAVHATVELFLDGFEAFRNVAPRCLDLLGAAA